MAKPPILMKREGSRLVPADPWALEQLDGIREGEEVHVRVTMVRKRGTLNLWWAGIGLLVQNLDEEDRKRWPSARKMHDALLEALGFVEKIWRIDGSYRTQVDSIALDNMSEEEFAELFEQAKALVMKLWGWDPWQTWLDERPPR